MALKVVSIPVQKDDIESQGTLGTLPAMTFTPDSKSVIASYGGKIYRIPIDGGEAVNIPFLIDEEIELGPLLKFNYPITDDDKILANQIRNPRISPDGRYLAYSAFHRIFIKELPDGEPKKLQPKIQLKICQFGVPIVNHWFMLNGMKKMVVLFTNTILKEGKKFKN